MGRFAAAQKEYSFKVQVSSKGQVKEYFEIVETLNLTNFTEIQT